MMIIYWQLCHFNAVALMQITEPWNICSAFIWVGSFLENFLFFVSCFPLPHFFEFPYPCMKKKKKKPFLIIKLLSVCVLFFLFLTILCICTAFTNQFY